MTPQEYEEQLDITHIRYLGDSVYVGIRHKFSPCIWTDNGLGPPPGSIISLEECQRNLAYWLKDIGVNISDR